MNAAPILPPTPADSTVVALEHHALDDLRYIRRTLEDAASFTHVPGWGQLLVGATAVGAAAVASQQPTAERWLLVWLAEAVLAASIGILAIRRKAQRAGVAPWSPATRRFAVVFSLPILAGAVLTAALWREQATALLPGTWLVLYGLAFLAGGAFSVGAVRAEGAAFAILGVLALWVPREWHDGVLALSFGGVHAIAGGWIARRHGG